MISDEHLGLVADVLDIIERQALADSPGAVANFVVGHCPHDQGHALGVAIGIAATLVREQARAHDVSVVDVIRALRVAASR